MNSFVAIMKCRFCGENTNSLVLDRHLKDIKGDVYDHEPCDKCKERIESGEYKAFIGDCGHSGIVKDIALSEMLTQEAYLQLFGTKTFRMEKCFFCVREE